MKSYKRGFTLIELLVVIAIIGLLAAVVLAAVNTARSKGGDAAVKDNLNSLRTQAELDNNSNGCYSNTSTCTAFAKAACANTANTLFGDSSIYNQITSAASAGGGLTSCLTTTNAAAYAVAVQLKSDPALAWCVDSSGNAKQEGTAGGTALTQAALNALIGASACS